MTALSKLPEMHPEEVEALLPWHAAGTLSARDARREGDVGPSTDLDGALDGHDSNHGEREIEHEQVRRRATDARLELPGPDRSIRRHVNRP